MNKKGIISFIHPNRFVNSDYGTGIRKFLLKNNGLKRVINFKIGQVFDTATTYTGIFFYTEGNKYLQYVEGDVDELNSLEFFNINIQTLGEKWDLSNENDYIILVICQL